MDEKIYQEEGFENREAYLKSLSEEYGIDLKAVKQIAEVLGPEEDFDMLPTYLQGE